MVDFIVRSICISIILPLPRRGPVRSPTNRSPLTPKTMPLLVAARHSLYPHYVVSSDHHHHQYHHRSQKSQKDANNSINSVILPEPLDFTMSKFKSSAASLFPGYLHNDDKGERSIPKQIRIIINCTRVSERHSGQGEIVI